MFGKNKKLPKGRRRSPLPALYMYTPEADNRAISKVLPEEIAGTLAKLDERLKQKFAETVQLELPFAEVSAQPVV